MAELVEKISGRKIELEFADPPPGEPDIYVTDHTKITRHLDWTPHCSVPSGVSKLIRWMSHNQDAVNAVADLMTAAEALGVPC
jgi:nucleoside-diphosphate-sugar epimerase